MPVTKAAGCHSATSASIARQRRSLAAASIVVSGLATRVTVLAMATPVRRAPKSNASTTASVIATTGNGEQEGTCRPASGSLSMADLPGELRRIDAQQPQRGVVALLRWHVEQDLRVRRGGEPGVAAISPSSWPAPQPE